MSHIHISLEHVNYSYDTSHSVLKDITFTAREHDAIGLIGANGAGKSTLLKLLVGLNLNYEGSIRIEDIPVEKNTLPVIREKTGYVFQDSDSQLFLSTVKEDVAFAPRNYGLSEDEVNRRVEHALANIHIEHLRDRQIYKLSGGEKQRTAICRAMAADPELILADEPTGNLDSRTSQDVLGLLKVTGEKFGQTIVMITHNEEIAQLADRMIRIEDGRIIEGGGTDA